MKKVLALVLILAMTCTMFIACAKDNGGKDSDTTTQAADKPVEITAQDIFSLDGKEYGKDYTALYEKFGKDVSIADVKANADGMAYITKDGKDYVLGLDFLSMAMVYKTTVPEGSTKYKTADDVYAEWWKYYITRWNALLPEIPLYSNEYYDLYNSKIGKVAENPTNPYWNAAYAVVDWTSSKTGNDIIMGNTTDLSGKFRYAAFGGTNPGAADNDIAKMTTGLDTVAMTKDGGFTWNNTVVKNHTEKVNEDGSKTYEIEFYQDLKWSDGTAITAKDYFVHALAFSTPVAAQAAQKDHKAGMYFTGYEAFAAYDGTNAGQTVGEGASAVVASKEFSGLKLIDTYKLSVTISADYLPYFYDISYAALSPEYSKMWLNTSTVESNEKGAFLSDDFYASTKDGDNVKYTLAAHIVASSKDTDDKNYPYSGAYVVKSFDTATKTAVLEKNANFKGNYLGIKPSIVKVTYKKIVSKTQLEDFKAGNLDLITGITGGDETNEAVKYADENKDKAAYIHYSRAGYGKLGFRADYGPARFAEVRQAIAYCMDRATFAKDFTGGYGGVVDGPYYTGSWMYKAAVKQGMKLNAYETSVESAKEVLIAGGWIYDKDGKAYTEGIRYKAIPASVATENDINYKSKDGEYVTTKVGDYYLIPLVINWYGTSENPFTEQLVTGFMENDNVKNAGMKVYNTVGEFNPMLDELYQQQIYGFYSGTPMYSAFNFATGFNSAMYDYSYNLTVDPSMYDDYSIYYFKDEADIFWLS